MTDRPGNPSTSPGRLRRRLWTLAALAAVTAAAFAVWSALRGGGRTPDPGEPPQPAGPIRVVAEGPTGVNARYVGRAACAECHNAETQAWLGSHHDLAMQVATEQTVLGDFDNVEFEHFGVTSRFFRRDGKFIVHTEGPDGAMRDYEVSYVFGVEPLQQYLVAFPGGRLQTLGLCWDTRPAASGGQRWFHIYPDERIDAEDPLFWAGPMQNWNMQCAECHSTNLRKNYDPRTDAYDTTFSEIDVSCEACHGPGSEHVVWAHAAASNGAYESHGDMGLLVNLKEPAGSTWITNPDTGLPERTVPIQSRAEVQTCGRCHSRRSVLSDDYVHGRSLLETHRPALLEQPLYHADGQINDEVYVWGSFLQSRMHEKGVRCVDCHDPHGLDLVMPVEQLCMKCHLGEQYATPKHHFHQAGGPGSSCVDCHMPHRTYMVVDPRRDHSFRVPRPDLSAKIGTPNACNDCHTEQSYEWAAEHFESWYGPRDDAPPHYALALDAGFKGRAGAGAELTRAARSDVNPPIVRATALALLENSPSEQSLATVREAMDADDPLLRLAALRGLAPFPPEVRRQVGAQLLRDEVLAVRVEAARVLASTDSSGDDDGGFRDALAELRDVLRYNADRPSSNVERGNLELNLGDADAAVAAYRAALERDPAHVPAYVNLADLYRRLGREDAVVATLRAGIERVPEAAALHQALGLALVRRQALDEAVAALRRAYQLAPGNARYAYVYAVALNSVGRGEDSLAVLDAALEETPDNAELLVATATIARDRGRMDLARTAARRLVELAPGNPQYRALLESLRGG